MHYEDPCNIRALHEDITGKTHHMLRVLECLNLLPSIKKDS